MAFQKKCMVMDPGRHGECGRGLLQIRFARSWLEPKSKTATKKCKPSLGSTSVSISLKMFRRVRVEGLNRGKLDFERTSQLKPQVKVAVSRTVVFIRSDVEVQRTNHPDVLEKMNKFVIKLGWKICN